MSEIEEELVKQYTENFDELALKALIDIWKDRGLDEHTIAYHIGYIEEEKSYYKWMKERKKSE